MTSVRKPWAIFLIWNRKQTPEAKIEFFFSDTTDIKTAIERMAAVLKQECEKAQRKGELLLFVGFSDTVFCRKFNRHSRCRYRSPVSVVCLCKRRSLFSQAQH